MAESDSKPESPRSPSGTGGFDVTGDFIAGQVLGRYRVQDVLQRGGMGEVVLADDLEAGGRRVVIKRLLEDFVADEDYLAMFRDEARIMSRLDHPNVVRVLDTPVMRGSMCLVMELVPGRSVAQMLREASSRAARISPNIAVRVMVEALRGLDYAHRAVDESGRPLDLVHRDISPGNILVSFEGDVKITDFGIAKSSLSVVATSVGMIKGTTRYLSPEQVRGGEVGPRSDLFASGAVLVEMLTGIPLFDRGQVPPTLLAIVKGQRPAISDVLPFDCPELAALLEQALALTPVHRPESAADMADALEAILPSLGSAVGPTELGAYLAAQFPDRSPADPGSSGRMGATYLIEVDDPVQEATAQAAVHRSTSGARPLDASEFEQPTRDIRPPTPLLRGRGSEPSRPLFEPDEVSGLAMAINSQDIEAEETDTGSALHSGASILDAVEAAARELEAVPTAAPEPEQPSDSASEPGVSDSAVEADAFHLTSSEAKVRRRLSWPSFGLGLVLGGGVVAALMMFWAPTPQGSSPSPALIDLPTEPTARTADPSSPAPEPVAAPATNTASTSTAGVEPKQPAAAEQAPEATGPGYLTIRRGRRMAVYIDDDKLPGRGDLRRLEVPAGRHKVVIRRRGRIYRTVDVVVQAGQHLDLSRSEIRVLEE